MLSNVVSLADEPYKEDVTACYRIINFGVYSTQEELNSKKSTIEDYIAQVKKYPTDKKEYLKEASIGYIYYLLSSLYDLHDYYIYYLTDSPKKTAISERTKKLKAKLENYSASKEVLQKYPQLIENEINKLPKNKTYLELSEDDQLEIMQLMIVQQDLIESYQQKAARAYQTIFRERFPKPEWATLEWLP